MDSYSNYGIVIPNGRVTGEVPVLCPQCSHTRKKKTQKCLSVNLDKRVWRCNHCGWSGFLKTEREVIEYKKPVWRNNTELSEKVVKWFEKRGISQKTLLDAFISESEEYIPQTGRKSLTINFNYLKQGELINVKYRDSQKNYKLFSGAELIFYNLDSIKDEKECFIVEGEMDALSFIQAGIKNVVSVPNGATTGTNNMQYLDNCIEYFMDKERIHLATDNDIAGRKLRDDIAERLGKYRCDYIDYQGYKDANEVLMAKGIQGIIDCIAKPIQFPLEGVYSIHDISDEIDDMYENGLDRGVDLGIPNFDLRIVKGYITTITGIPSHGKSDWLDYICLQLRIKANWNGAFYSPENKPTQLHFSKMARKIIGKNWDGKERINPIELRMVKEYLDKKMFFLKPEKDFKLTSILNMVRDIQQRYGIDYFVIDAWNKLHHNETDTDSIGKSLDELALFCEVNNIHCFLVAHPTKMKKENGIYEVPTLYNIAGSSNFYNKTDNGITVYRDFNKGITSVYRQKIKFDHWGVEGFSDYEYDVKSKRFNQLGFRDESNWITDTREQKALNFSTGEKSFFSSPNEEPPF